MDDETELTEMVALDVRRQDGVRTPASGFRFLVKKDVNASGQVNEKPDIAGANKVLAMLAKLIASEAAELAAGCEDEAYDISLLLNCMSEMRYFRDRESANAEMAKDIDAVNAVIAERSNESGEPTPMAEDAKKDAPASHECFSTTCGCEPESTEATETSEVGKSAAEDTFSREDVSKMIEDALAETVSKAAEERDKALADLAVLKATPQPGGPALMAPATVRTTVQKAEAVAKARYFEGLASTVQDKELIRFYTDKAAEARKLADG